MRSFSEYINNRGKVVEKAKVEEIPDYDGPQPAAPPKAVTKGKNWDTKAKTPKEAPKPYKGPGKDPGLKKQEKGLAHEGDKKLCYNPKTESFLRQTKDMSLAEFTKYMTEECGCGGNDDEDMPAVTAYAPGKFHPHPPEVIKYITFLSNKNDGVLNNMVHEMKRSGGLGKLIKALMSHPETFEELASLFGDEEEGPKHCQCLAKAMDSSYQKFLDDQDDMYESVGPPFGLDAEDDSEDEDDDTSDMNSDDMDSDDDSDMDSDMDSDDEMGSGSDSDSDFDSEDSDEDMNADDADQDDDSSEEHPDFDSYEDDPFGSNSNDEEPKPKKLKKKFGHHNLINAFASQKHLSDAMKSHMNGY